MKFEQHPNKIKVLKKYVDETPLIYDSVESYPIALPKSCHPEGMGRNKTLFLVMPKYSCSLREYLCENKEQLTFRQRLHLFCQLLNGVAHLERNNICHRDLKTDNVLMDLSKDALYPQLVLTDFGNCLTTLNNDMLLQFETYDIDLGGNAALMAPEVNI